MYSLLIWCFFVLRSSHIHCGQIHEYAIRAAQKQKPKMTTSTRMGTDDENDDDEKSSNVKHIYGIAFNFFL